MLFLFWIKMNNKINKFDTYKIIYLFLFINIMLSFKEDIYKKQYENLPKRAIYQIII